jgi:hypothetical protein
MGFAQNNQIFFFIMFVRELMCFVLKTDLGIDWDFEFNQWLSSLDHAVSEGASLGDWEAEQADALSRASSRLQSLPVCVWGWCSQRGCLTTLCLSFLISKAKVYVKRNLQEAIQIKYGVWDKTHILKLSLSFSFVITLIQSHYFWYCFDLGRSTL